MSNSGILKSSLAKKYWLAATGLFLCLFLIGHLAGNLQLLSSGYEAKLAFNTYAVFMVSNPVVMVLSYLTYFSIVFHAVDGAVITYKNRKARPKGYVYNKPSRNSPWNSRNMGFLGTLLLAFIVFHMWDFWYRFKFGTLPHMTGADGTSIFTRAGEEVIGGRVENGMVLNAGGDVVGPMMKDLYTAVIEAFQQPWIVAVYLIGMVVLALHLHHGVQAAFHSLGLKTPVTRRTIYFVGRLFAVVIALGFASIPVYVYLTN